ncbi:MAG TPA: hypothetical protein VLS89_14795 [Candidatus Nanopelagicales bacterium]|nr:hypothetical protein [Candidatus Nanopelagicales bacterium]
MRSKPPRLSILILSEDGARDACDTITALAKKMLLLVDGAVQTHRIEFQPQDEDSRWAMRGNDWRSRSETDRPKIVQLGRVIAAKLLEEDPPGFVLFHFDGDQTWADRSLCKHAAQFEEFLRAYVEQNLDNTLRRRAARRGQKVDVAVVEQQKSAAMKRLLRLTPFYSIEAWVYQNTVEARKRCKEGCGLHLDLIAGWEANRGALDEVQKPKEELCLEGRHNLALASTAYPAAEVHGAGKSFAFAVENLRRCHDLREALSRTYA